MGRAKGFGGPEAPALRRALADGDGGGRTTEWCGSDPVPLLAGVAVVAPPDSLGEDSAVALPASECSLGICTWSLGRPVLELFVAVRDGG